MFSEKERERSIRFQQQRLQQRQQQQQQQRAPLAVPIPLVAPRPYFSSFRYAPMPPMPQVPPVSQVPQVPHVPPVSQVPQVPQVPINPILRDGSIQSALSVHSTQPAPLIQSGFQHGRSTEVYFPPLPNAVVPSFQSSRASAVPSNPFASYPPPPFPSYQHPYYCVCITNTSRIFSGMQGALFFITVILLTIKGLWLNAFPDSMKVFASNSARLSELGLSSLLSSLEGLHFDRLPNSLSSKPFPFPFPFPVSSPFSSLITFSYSTTSYFYHSANPLSL